LKFSAFQFVLLNTENGILKTSFRNFAIVKRIAVNAIPICENSGPGLVVRGQFVEDGLAYGVDLAKKRAGKNAEHRYNSTQNSGLLKGLGTQAESKLR